MLFKGADVQVGRSVKAFGGQRYNVGIIAGISYFIPLLFKELAHYIVYKCLIAVKGADVQVGRSVKAFGGQR